MNTDKVDDLLQLISEVVSLGGTWQDKKNQVLSQASTDELTNLQEFIGWFEDLE